MGSVNIDMRSLLIKVTLHSPFAGIDEPVVDLLDRQVSVFSHFRFFLARRVGVFEVLEQPLHHAEGRLVRDLEVLASRLGGRPSQRVVLVLALIVGLRILLEFAFWDAEAPAGVITIIDILHHFLAGVVDIFLELLNFLNNIPSLVNSIRFCCQGE